MCDLPLDVDEFRSLIGELVPAHQQSQVLSALELPGATETDFDQLGTALTGEQSGSGFIFYTSTGAHSKVSLWVAIKAEMYDLFCTKSNKYTAERKEGVLTVKNIVTIIATAVAASFNVALGVVTGAVTLALMCVLKVGRNAWCAINEPKLAAPN